MAGASRPSSRRSFASHLAIAGRRSRSRTRIAPRISISLIRSDFFGPLKSLALRAMKLMQRECHRRVVASHIRGVGVQGRKNAGRDAMRTNAGAGRPSHMSGRGVQPRRSRGRGVSPRRCECWGKMPQPLDAANTRILLRKNIIARGEKTTCGIPSE